MVEVHAPVTERFFELRVHRSPRGDGPGDPAVSVGQVLDGKYRIEAFLGKGSTGTVYRARHLDLGSLRAIKVLHRELAESEDMIRRFRTEAQLTEELRHPNLVTLYDLASLRDGSLYIVWEYVDGETLASLLKKGVVFTPAEVADLVGQVADGLAAAHARGILHRDISPDNLMVTETSEGRRLMKVLDFGMARVVGGVTQTGYAAMGVYLGKIGYSSPEQVGLLEDDEQLDARTDVFSLAVVAYHMLAGKLPFRTSNIQTFLFDLTTAPEHLVRARFEESLPPAWRKPMARTLRRDREARTPSMEALRRDLEEAARKTAGAATVITMPRRGGFTTAPAETVSRRAKPVRLLAALAVAGALAVAAWMALRPSAELPVPAPPPPSAVDPIAAEPIAPPEPPPDSAPVAPPEEPLAAAVPAPPVAVNEPGSDSRPVPELPSSTEDSIVSDLEDSVLPGLAPPRPLPGELIVESTPSAEVLLDGESAGRTPLRLEVAAGSYDLVLSTAEGARSWRRVDLSPGASVTVSSRLDLYGSLSVTSDTWAEVSLDGGAPEQTPVFFRRIPVGPHRIRATRPGYEEQVLEVEVEEGRTTSVRLGMERVR